MRKLGLDRLHDIEQMTLTEFHYKRRAQEYKEVDEQYRLHLSAFLVRNAGLKVNKGTAKKPKEEYQFKQFHEFFDYEKELKNIEQGFTDTPKQKESSSELAPWEIALQRNTRKG